MARKSADAFRTISEVSEWLDTPAHVLRFWESKFTQVKPVKRAGGRRYYRPADMQLLGGIKKLLHDDGLTIKGAQKLLRENGIRYVAAMSPPLDDELEQFVDPAPVEAPVALDVEPDVGEVVPFERAAPADPKPAETKSPEPVSAEEDTPAPVDAASSTDAAPEIHSAQDGDEPAQDETAEAAISEETEDAPAGTLPSFLSSTSDTAEPPSLEVEAESAPQPEAEAMATLDASDAEPATAQASDAPEEQPTAEVEEPELETASEPEAQPAEQTAEEPAAETEGTQAFEGALPGFLRRSADSTPETAPDTPDEPATLAESDTTAPAVEEPADPEPVIAEEAAPSTPEVAPAEVPADPKDADVTAAPGPLSRLAEGRPLRVKADDLRPLVARLAALRDKMANARHR